MEERIDEIVKDLESYDMIIDFAIVKKVNNQTVDVQMMQRNYLYTDCLVIGNFKPVEDTKGILLHVGKTKYPVFWPFNTSSNDGDKYLPGTLIYNAYNKGNQGVTKGTIEDNIKLLIKTAKVFGIYDTNQICYILATVEHECGFIPKNEIGGNNRSYAPWFGRGFVQLTYKTNYEFYKNLTNVDIVTNRELANEPNLAAFICVHGMKYGTFRAGNKLDDYINGDKIDFYNARNIIQSRLESARTIQNLAISWQSKIINYLDNK